MQERMFGKIAQGSMRGSSLILFQTAIGAGALGLPGAAIHVGMVGESIILVLCAYQVWWVLCTLGHLSVRCKTDNYPDLIMHVTQNKIWV